MESTFNWYWLVDGLMRNGYKAKLVNTSAIRQYSGLKHSDDEYDAWWLVHIQFDTRTTLSLPGEEKDAFDSLES